MTRGEQFVESLRLKHDFYDRHERRSYLRMVEVAKRIVDQPSLLRAGDAFLERFARSDPQQATAYATWKRTLTLSAEEVARQLLEDSDRGANLRDTAPVFVVVPRDELNRAWRAPTP
ncbi:MAG: hypothetical protein Q7T09_00400 [Phenylobacterium sp.]|nr:hypothetical protein [Phenylobacterium sp.]